MSENNEILEPKHEKPLVNTAAQYREPIDKELYDEHLTVENKTDLCSKIKNAIKKFFIAQ